VNFSWCGLLTEGVGFVNERKRDHPSDVRSLLNCATSISFVSKIRCSIGLLVLQHNNIARAAAGKQRPDQLRGHGLVALRTLIPLQAIG
jgi:hypothetical protein